MTVDLDPHSKVWEVGSTTENQEVKISEESEREAIEMLRIHRQCS